MLKKLLAVIALTVATSSVQAALQIEITGGINEGHRIAVIPFTQASGINTDVASVVSSDLMRSGKFSPVAMNTLPQGSVVNGEIVVDKAAASGGMTPAG